MHPSFKDKKILCVRKAIKIHTTAVHKFAIILTVKISESLQVVHWRSQLHPQQRSKR